MKNVQNNKIDGLLIKLNETNLMSVVNRKLTFMKVLVQNKIEDSINVDLYCEGVEVDTVSINEEGTIEEVSFRYMVVISKEQIVSTIFDMSTELTLEHCIKCNPSLKKTMIDIRNLEEAVWNQLDEHDVLGCFLTVIGS